MGKELKNKPLVEAVFELKWQLKPSPNGGLIDPDYKILVGMLYAKLSQEYPFHESLPAANMPDEMAAYIVQNRFRVSKDKWPVVQIGPGILSINDTINYKWNDFEKRILNVLDILMNIYPHPENLTFNSLTLRYIDSMDLDLDKEDILTFLREKMHTDVKFYEKLFEQTGVTNLPTGFELKGFFNSTKPKGGIALNIGRGEINNVPKIVLDTLVVSSNKDVPQEKEKIQQWIKEAHILIDDWFFKLIEGKLEKEFE